MLLEKVIKKLKDASRIMFFKLNSSDMVQKKYIDYNVIVKFGDKKLKITDIRDNDTVIYIETEEE